MNPRPDLLFLIRPLMAVFVPWTAVAAPVPDELGQRFPEEVHGFMQSYCFSCHGEEETKSDLDLTTFSSPESIAANPLLWETVLEQIEDGEMPPRKAKQHPATEEREAMMAWIRELRQYTADQNSGDPGPVRARRLSNAEYDYTIRDLTGVDIRPAREFPVDPANEAGFDNSSESLTMSPALLTKYLEAARRVADHLVLTPEGLEFAAHPVLADTDRDKHGVRKIIEFYQSQPTDLADYFAAAWQYQHRLALEKPDLTLAEAAAEAQVSEKYLHLIWSTLTAENENIGPIAALQTLWRELPSSAPASPEELRWQFEQMRDFTVALRAEVQVEVPNLRVKGMNPGAQPLVLWKNRQMASSRRSYGGGALERDLAAIADGSAAREALTVPDDEAGRTRYEAAFRKFCDVFPDAFFISERGRVFLPDGEDASNTGRYLSAGLHNQMGYFRDDQPLYDLILDAQGQRTLDALWDSFYFSSAVPMRMHSGHIWHERAESGFIRGAEFEFARPEDKDITAEPKFSRFAELYLARVQEATSDEVIRQAVKEHTTLSAAAIRKVEQARQSAEPAHISALGDFAERAWRRPVLEDERQGIARFYHSLRDEEKLPHEDAVRDTLASVLMSPHFCYRLDLPGTGADAAMAKVEPLSSYELANRLSYFLWSSMPDEALLESAAAGDLREEEVLVSHVHRMLADPKINGLAKEFAGNWLDFRRFEEHNAVDRERFPSFDSDLRQAMFEEPLRFFEDVVRHDRPVSEFLFGRHTFVNASLAGHYGMDPPANPQDWIRVENADQFGRGGLLPMAVFLTRNAPGLRTSPVKRGYWVVRRILGEHIPAPPPDVPELPEDEANSGTLTLRQALEKHREDPNCAACHARFDSFGLVFEGYGPVGEQRTLDLGGRPVETHAEFPGGGEGSGLDDLKTYLREHRQQDFVENLCRKLLAYGLGRGLIPSDDATLAAMRSQLAAEDERFSALIISIVTSPQFLNKRTAAATSAR